MIKIGEKKKHYGVKFQVFLCPIKNSVIVLSLQNLHVSDIFLAMNSAAAILFEKA